MQSPDLIFKPSGLRQAAVAAQWKAMALDAQSSEPYFAQLKRQLRDLIERGGLQQGENLPSERLLANALQVSRTTVKRAYDELRAEGLLSTHGRGGTVARGTALVRPTLGKLKGFTQEMRELGMAASSQLQERAVVRNRVMASLFGRPSTAQFLRLVRVRLGDGVPMTRETAWYDLGMAPALNEWDAGGSAYEYLREKCGVFLTGADQSVEAVLSSPEEDRVFGFATPQPCLLFKRHTRTANEQLVEYVEGVFRGDAYVYRLQLET